MSVSGRSKLIQAKVSRILTTTPMHKIFNELFFLRQPNSSSLLYDSQQRKKAIWINGFRAKREEESNILPWDGKLWWNLWILLGVIFWNVWLPSQLNLDTRIQKATPSTSVEFHHPSNSPLKKKKICKSAPDLPQPTNPSSLLIYGPKRQFWISLLPYPRHNFCISSNQIKTYSYIHTNQSKSTYHQLLSNVTD